MSAFEAFDTGVEAAIHGLRTPVLTAVMRAWTVLGGTIVVTAAVLVLAALLWERGRRVDAASAVALVGGGALLSTILKRVVERVRPVAAEALLPLPGTHSFPSGHALASLCLAAALVLAFRGAGLRSAARIGLAGAMVLYALGVAFSRVYLGVHWPSDVVGSWALGAVWIAVVFVGRRWWVRSHAEV